MTEQITFEKVGRQLKRVTTKTVEEVITVSLPELQASEAYLLSELDNVRALIEECKRFELDKPEKEEAPQTAEPENLG